MQMGKMDDELCGRRRENNFGKMTKGIISC